MKISTHNARRGESDAVRAATRGGNTWGNFNVSAQDKPNQIPITDEQESCLSSESDRMVQEAETSRDEDEANKSKIEIEKGSENFCFIVRN